VTIHPGAKTLNVVDLGETEYRHCWRLQQEVHARRRARLCADTLLLTTHRHVYTIGKTGDDDHLLAGREELVKSGADVVHTDRGGDITYHGPGQLVAYPILDLNDHGADVHRYLRDLEEAVIGAIAEHGLKGEREPGYTGVWVGGEKIAAIGVRVSGWITMHGLALNVFTDLGYFGRIIPCGIAHLGVTSMEQRLGTLIPIDAVADSVVRNFERIFSLAARPARLADILGVESPIVQNA
jgi:lipoyl(octanoyl) transferase